MSIKKNCRKLNTSPTEEVPRPGLRASSFEKGLKIIPHLPACSVIAMLGPYVGEDMRIIAIILIKPQGMTTGNNHS